MLYSIARWLFIVLFFLFFRYRVYGRDNIPRAPFIVCSNHMSWLDPPLVACIFERRHQVYFMAKEELFDIPLLGLILERIGSFPVKKDTADRRAITKALQLLKDDKVVGMFPEGTRSRKGKLQQFFDGASWIALKSQTPVVPVAIKGPYRLFRPTEVFIGPPLYFDYYRQGKKYGRDDLKEVSGKISRGIYRLLEEETVS